MIFIHCPSRNKQFFIQVMKALSYELFQFGYKNSIVHNIPKPTNSDKKDVIILFGFHDSSNDKSLIKSFVNFKTVAYNSEQLHAKNWGIFLSGLKHVDQIWDYSMKNIKYLNKIGFYNTIHVPIGYSKSFVTPNVNQETRELDSLVFFGSMNAKRRENIDKIRKSGNKVDIKRSVWNTSYQKMIKEHGLYLNIHYFEAAILEIFRIVPLLSNNSVVVTEISDDKDLDEMYKPYLNFFDFDKDFISFKDLKEEAIKKKVEKFEKFKKEMAYSQIIKDSGCLNIIEDPPENIEKEAEKNITVTYGVSKRVKDVTDTFKTQFIKNGSIFIPKDTWPNKYFGDPCPNKVKKITITIGNQNPIILNEYFKKDYELKIN